MVQWSEVSAFPRKTFAIIDKQDWRLNPTRFSKWYRVSSNRRLESGRSPVRVRSWVKRFIKNSRVPPKQPIKEELKANELQDTKLEIIRETQQEEYNEEISALTARRELYKRSPLLWLTPMLDSGILHANTRPRHSEDLTKGIKFPIILPKKHPVTQLIVKYYHERESHEMGVNYTLNHLHQQYHIIHSRHIGSLHKWFLQQKNLKENDTVVVIDPNATQRDWKVGRIVRTYPGEDGLIQVEIES